MLICPSLQVRNARLRQKCLLKFRTGRVSDGKRCYDFVWLKLYITAGWCLLWSLSWTKQGNQVLRCRLGRSTAYCKSIGILCYRIEVRQITWDILPPESLRSLRQLIFCEGCECGSQSHDPMPDNEHETWHETEQLVRMVGLKQRGQATCQLHSQNWIVFFFLGGIMQQNG